MYHYFIIMYHYIIITYLYIINFIILIYLLAQVTYNQVQPLRFNYLASNHRGKIINYYWPHKGVSI